MTKPRNAPRERLPVFRLWYGGAMTSPSRTPEARKSEYLRNRKQRECKQCQAPIKLGSRRLLCDPCRETPDPRCKKCKKVKPLTRFSRDSTRPSGYFPWCMDCQQAGVKAAGFQNPEDPPNGHVCPMCDTPVRGHRNRRFCSNGCKDRTSRLKHSYNLTPQQYRRMVDAMEGRCPLCRNRVTQWHVDHAHKGGRVMSVVCAACNVGALAMTYHDVEYVERLLDFLRNPPALGVGVDVHVPEGSTKPSNLHRVWGRRKNG